MDVAVNNPYTLQNTYLLQVLSATGIPISGKTSKLSIVVAGQTDIDKAYSILFNGVGNENNVTLANITLASNILPETTAFDQLSKTKHIYF